MPRRRRGVDAVNAGLVGAAVLAYVATDVPWVDTLCYLGVLVGAAVSSSIAALRATGQRIVLGLIALGVTLSVAGDVVWEVLDAAGADTDVSLADPFWFASYVALCAAMWKVLAQSRPDERVDAGFVIDAVTVVAVSVLVFWHVSIADIVADPGAPEPVRAVWAAYPVADAVLLALVVRVLLSPRARALVGRGFAVGVLLWLAADAAYLRDPSGVGESVMDAAWMVAPTLMARAAWHWSPAPRDRVVVVPPPSTSMAPLVIAVVPLLVPPMLEVVDDVRGQPDRPLLLLVGSLVLIVLTFLRTARLLRAERTIRRELEVARDEALAASRAKSVFVATVSHEIRTPLTVVLAAAEMLDESPLMPEQQDWLRRMRRSGALLHRLVEDVLDFSRIEAGTLSISPVDVDLHCLVDHVAETFRPRAEAAGLVFESSMGPDVPRHVVVDPERLQQVAGNLLDNALKFTDRGAIRLEVRCAGATPDPGTEPGQVEIVVTDTGVGIASDQVDRVLGAFEQGDGSSTRRHGGVGLGLAICRELLTLMDGSLRVHSEPGSGSQFIASFRAPSTPDPGRATPSRPAVRSH